MTVARRQTPVAGQVLDQRWGGNFQRGRTLAPLTLPAEFVDAACAEDTYPSEWWDDIVEGETRVGQKERHELARRVCAECPISKLCALFAAQRDPDDFIAGIWGGDYYPTPAKIGGA